MEKLLEVKALQTNFFTSRGVLPVVDGVTFHMGYG